MTDRIKSLIDSRGNIIMYDNHNTSLLIVIGRCLFMSNITNAVHDERYLFNIMSEHVKDGVATMFTSDGEML